MLEVVAGTGGVSPQSLPDNSSVSVLTFHDTFPLAALLCSQTILQSLVLGEGVCPP